MYVNAYKALLWCHCQCSKEEEESKRESIIFQSRRVATECIKYNPEAEKVTEIAVKSSWTTSEFQGVENALRLVLNSIWKKRPKNEEEDLDDYSHSLPYSPITVMRKAHS